MKPAPPVMSARIMKSSPVGPLKSPDERDAAAKAAERAAVETLVHRGAAVQFQDPGGVDAEGGLAADRAAELEGRRVGVALRPAGKRQRQTDILVELEIRKRVNREELVAPRIVVAVVQVVRGLEDVRRGPEVEVEPGAARHRAA